jgi:uncharacterized protein (TIGR02996 family)
MHTPYDSEEWEALKRNIIANAQHDLPRLVAADWLTENGEEDHGEFIRVQCELDAKRKEVAEFIRDGKYKREEAEAMDWDVVKLHDREMELLWAKNRHYNSANWEIWCHAEAREEDGGPCLADGRGGMTKTPHGSIGLGEGSNSCTVPFTYTETARPSYNHRVTQYFRRGFVDRVDAPYGFFVGDNSEQGQLLIRNHPVTEIRLRDKDPLPANRLLNLDCSWLFWEMLFFPGESYLHAGVGEHMIGSEGLTREMRSDDGVISTMGFDSRTSALAAASRGIIAMIRSEGE